MPHPIYGRPPHQLQAIRLTLVLPTAQTNHATVLEAHGDTSTSRKPLWTYREQWARDEQRGCLEPTDAVHWLILAAAQDRPNSQEAFDRCTMPGGWEDVPLPL